MSAGMGDQGHVTHHNDHYNLLCFQPAVMEDLRGEDM